MAMKRACETLFHISDTHFGVEDPAALAWFERSVRAQRPDAIVCTGDLTQRATRRQYRAAAQWFAGFDCPLMVMPGNHDMPYFNLWERFRRPFSRFDALERVVGREIALEHAVIVPLQTNVAAQMRWPWSDGVVTRRNLAETLKRLEELARDPRIKLVACHHPLLSARAEAKNPTIGGDDAFEALARAGAAAVLSGHVHYPFDQTRAIGNRAVRMIGAGTLSTRLRGAPPSFNVIRIARDGAIDVERRELSPLSGEESA